VKEENTLGLMQSLSTLRGREKLIRLTGNVEDVYHFKRPYRKKGKKGGMVGSSFLPPGGLT